jgi:hypothetical protein
MKTSHKTKRDEINHREHIDHKDKAIQSMRSLWLIFCLLYGLTGFSVSAQIQQAWAARYNNGITNGTNQAVKMVLDPQAHLCGMFFTEYQFTAWLRHH